MDRADALLRLVALARRVDEFFERVHARHAGAMACRAGCSACCHARLSLTAVEAAWLRDWLAQLEPDARRELAVRAARAPTDRCAALGQDGRCQIYERRPLVCRSHGLPLRRRGERRLPIVESCALNFTPETVPLDEVDDGSVLDQDTLWTVLAGIEAAYSRAAGSELGSRTDLAELLASLEPEME